MSDAETQCHERYRMWLTLKQVRGQPGAGGQEERTLEASLVLSLVLSLLFSLARALSLCLPMRSIKCMDTETRETRPL